MDNYASVLHQMEAFGIEFTARDLPLVIPTPKRKTCGVKGKDWYWLQLFRPRNPDGAESGAEYIVGRFGTYKHGGSDQKVELDHKPLTDAERERFKAERAAAQERSRQVKAQDATIAALSAGDLWQRGFRCGRSPYLERKGVEAEACRYLWDGSIIIALRRYDQPGEELRGVQRIYPGPRFNEAGEELPQKTFTKNFAKTGCALRLGDVDKDTWLVLVCEGYATGLSIRMATECQLPVYVALDAYNLAHVVEILRRLHPKARLLICADDDWKSGDHEGPNPGRRYARLAAKATDRCDFTWPVFDTATRQDKDTDFNDLHMREGLEVAAKQLATALTAIRQWRAHGR